MLLERVDKEPPDLTRIVADMAWWLDEGETIADILSSEIIQGMAGWSEAPYPPRDAPPPYDPTPVKFRGISVDAQARQLIVLVEFGTSGVAYTLRFVLLGTSQRKVTIELGVQVTGVPPEEPLPVPVPIPPMKQGALALSITGGTMQGPLYLFQDPLYPTEAATKDYVDGMSWVGGPYMPEAGGTFTGPVVMTDTLTLAPDDPTDPLGATTKQYVDGRVASVGTPYLRLSGGTMTGSLILAGDPTADLEATPKRYVDAHIPVGGPFLSLSGGTMTGLLLLYDDPVDPKGAVTKRYADGLLSAGGAQFLPISGGTMTGPLVLAGDPTTASQAATRHYVDNAPFLLLAGGQMLGGIGFGNALGTGNADTSRHLTLNPNYGLGITPNRLNVVAAGVGAVVLMTGAGDRLTVNSAGVTSTVPMTLNQDTDSTFYINGTGTSWPAIKFNSAVTGTTCGLLQASRNGLKRWSLELGTGQGELGGNVGSWFSLRPFDDAGNPFTPIMVLTRAGTGYIDTALSIGQAPKNVLTITPGAASTNPVVISQSGTGGISFSSSFSSGISFGTTLAGSVGDLTRHIALYGPNFGFSVTSNRLNYAVDNNSSHVFMANLNDILSINNAGAVVTGTLTSTGNATFGSTGAGPIIAVGSNAATNLVLRLNSAANAQRNLAYTTAGINRWNIGFAAHTEIGDNGAPNLQVFRYNDDGSFGGTVMSFFRSSGLVTVAGDPTTPTGIATKQYADKFATGVTPMTGGLTFGSALAPGGTTDITRHIALFGTSFGFGVTSARLNYLAGGSNSSHVFIVNSLDVATINALGLTLPGTVAANAVTAAQLIVAGSNASATVTSISMNTAAGTQKYLNWQTAGVARWSFVTTAAAESGGNAGTDLLLIRYADAGTNLGNAMTINRSSGNITFGGGVGFNGTTAIARQTVTGSRGGNAALASLITALAAYGLVTDSTSA